MKKTFFGLIGLSILLLCSCQPGGMTKVSATGSIYECLVVMPKTPLNEEQLEQVGRSSLYGNGSIYDEPIANSYDLVRSVMAADMPCLPQMEPYFKLTQVPYSAFDDILKPTRNILYIDINPQRYTHIKATATSDAWSHPQALYRIQAPDMDSFITYWLAHGEEVREWFVRQELTRQLTFYRANTNKVAREAMQRFYGHELWIPEDYMLIDTTCLELHPLVYTSRGIVEKKDLKEDVHVLWCCNNKGPMRRDIVVYSYPYTDVNTFTAAYLNARRDQVLGMVVSASVEGSYMGTEYKVFPPQMRQVQPLQVPGLQADSTQGTPAFYAMEVRGLWKIYHGEAMGGPYVSHTHIDEQHGRVITVETFLFAPGQKKRNALRQSEAILYSL